MTEQAERAAWHEAGHAVASFRLGMRNAGPVAVLPDGSGVCFAGQLPPPARRDGLDRTAALMPARTRRWLETEIMSLLAGTIAEEIFWCLPRTVSGAGRGQRLPPATSETAGEILAAAAMPAREGEMLAGHWSRGDRADDASRAAELEWCMHGDDLASSATHLQYMETLTRRLLACAPGPQMMTALAPELARRGELSSRQWRAILAAE